MSLPIPVSTFVGRDADLAALPTVLAERRLVTLVGAGGCGKTRLALEVGRLLERQSRTVVWVDLAPLTDASLVPTALAAALGIAEPPAPVVDAIVRHLANRPVVVVLDCCEHLIETCASVAARVVQEAPEAAVLSTSRELLGIAGEVRWSVPPLPLPVGEDAGDALRLFVDRARTSQPDFSTDAESLQAIEEICRRLDGIPLAIELAAARTRMLSVYEIVEGLTDRFRLLTGGDRTALPRQRTLEGSVDWSHALLNDGERRALRSLSVFTGSFTVDAATYVCVGPNEPERTDDAFHIVTALVERSLLQVVSGGRQRRFRMLETIRDYARHKLADSGEVDDARQRFLDWCTAFANEAARGLEGPEHLRWLDLVDAELDNIRGALDVAAHAPDKEAGPRITGALLLYWFTRGEMAIGRTRIETAIRRGSPGRDRVAALTSLCVIAYRSGLINEATRFGDEAVAIARDLDDQLGLGRALHHRAWVSFWGRSDPTAAWADLDEAGLLLEAIGDTLFHALNSAILGWTYVDTTRTPAAHRLLDNALEVLPSAGAARANALVARGWLHQVQGRVGDAQDDLTEALRVAAEAGDRYVELVARCILATVDAETGQADRAHQQVTHGLVLAREHRLPFPEACMRFAGAIASLATTQITEATEELDAAYRRTPLTWFRAVLRGHQARVALRSGLADLARAFAEDALQLAETGDSVRTTVLAEATLADLELADGHPEVAEQRYRTVLDLAYRSELEPLVAVALHGLASVFTATGREDDAAAIRQTVGGAARETQWLRHVAGIEQGESASRSVGTTEPGALTLNEAVALVGRRTVVPSRRPPHGWQSLTDAERRVVALVTQGLTNRQIGQRLNVSPRTVQTHLAHIFAKLEMSTRAELAAAAAVQAVARPGDKGITGPST